MGTASPDLEKYRNLTIGRPTQERPTSVTRKGKPNISGKDSITINNAPVLKISPKKSPTYSEGDLRKIVSDGKQAKPPLSAYQALLEEGHISTANEFLE